MGADLHGMMEDANRKRGRDYISLKRRLCALLSLECQFDVTGPGDDRGATDQNVLDAVANLVHFPKTPNQP